MAFLVSEKGYKLIELKSFEKAMNRLLKKFPPTDHFWKQYRKALDLLCLNPNHPGLNVHTHIDKDIKYCYRANINKKYRFIFCFGNGQVNPNNELQEAIT